MKSLVCVSEGADQMGVTKARMYAMIRNGILPSGVVVRLGRQIRINSEELNRWIEGGGQALPGGWRRTPNNVAVGGEVQP